jgi:hypothetical protein
MKIARLASLKGFKGVLLGRDIGDILKNGHVYSISEVMGVIMIQDLGKHAVSKYQQSGASISQCANEGVYCLTEDEYKKQLKQEGVLDDEDY